jgi:Transposase DDE domain group 1
MIRARSSLTWRLPWRWAVTAWLISRYCARSRGCAGQWPRTRVVSGWSRSWPPTRRGALKAIRVARAAARERAWALAGRAAPGADRGLITIDIDATVVTAHSDKVQAAPTWKKTFGFHVLAAFADHGPEGSGEPLAIMLRPDNAGSNTAPTTSRQRGWR